MISTFPPEKCGIGDYASALCITLADLGVKTNVYTYGLAGCPSTQFVSERLVVHRTLRRFAIPWNPLRTIGKIEADAVHFQLAPGLHHASLSFLQKWMLCKPTVLTVHEAPAPDDYRRSLPAKVFYQSARRIIVHSEVIRNRLIGEYNVSANRIQKMFHGASLPDIGPINGHATETENPINVLFIGFLRPNKGIETLLHAFQKVSHNCVLTIAGGKPKGNKRFERKMGRYHESLLTLTDQLSLGHRVRFTGYVPDDDFLATMNSADIIVLPYKTVSQSGILYRAFAAGKAVITSDASGFAELIQHKVNGLLHPMGDVEALRRQIERLSSDTHFRRRLGHNARAFAEREFAWEKIAAQHIDVYRDLCEASSSKL